MSVAVRNWVVTVANHICIRSSSGRGRTDGGDGSTGTLSAILAPTALDRSTVDHLPLKLNNSHGSVFVSVKFDESETAVSLHPDL